MTTQYHATLADIETPEGTQAEGVGPTPAAAASRAAQAAGIDPMLVRVTGRDEHSGEWSVVVGDAPVVVGTVVAFVVG